MGGKAGAGGDRGFGHNFHGLTEWDLHFIDRIHAIDSAASAEGRITPTHLLARFQNEPGDCVCPHGMTPRSGVRVVEPGPPAGPEAGRAQVAQGPATAPAAAAAGAEGRGARPVSRPVPLYRRLRGLD